MGAYVNNPAQGIEAGELVFDLSTSPWGGKTFENGLYLPLKDANDAAKKNPAISGMVSDFGTSQYFLPSLWVGCSHATPDAASWSNFVWKYFQQDESELTICNIDNANSTIISNKVSECINCNEAGNVSCAVTCGTSSLKPGQPSACSAPPDPPSGPKTSSQSDDSSLGTGETIGIIAGSVAVAGGLVWYIARRKR